MHTWAFGWAGRQPPDHSLCTCVNQADKASSPQPASHVALFLLREFLSLASSPQSVCLFLPPTLHSLTHALLLLWATWFCFYFPPFNYNFQNFSWDLNEQVIFLIGVWIRHKCLFEKTPWRVSEKKTHWWLRQRNAAFLLLWTGLCTPKFIGWTPNVPVLEIGPLKR